MDFLSRGVFFVEITVTSAPVSISNSIGLSLTDIMMDHGLSSARVTTPMKAFFPEESESESESVPGLGLCLLLSD